MTDQDTPLRCLPGSESPRSQPASHVSWVQAWRANKSGRPDVSPMRGSGGQPRTGCPADPAAQFNRIVEGTSYPELVRRRLKAKHGEPAPATQERARRNG